MISRNKVDSGSTWKEKGMFKLPAWIKLKKGNGDRLESRLLYLEENSSTHDK